MATFEEIKLKIKLLPDFSIRQEIGDYLLSQAVNDAVWRVQEDLSSRFDQITASPITLTAGTLDYALPSDYKEMQDVFYRKAGATDKVHLTRRSKEWFDLHYSDPASLGTPSAWLIWAGSLRIGPTPNTTGDQILLDYEAFNAALANGSPTNSNALTLRVPEVLRWAGAEQLALYAGLPAARIQAFAALYQAALVRARRMMRAEQVSGTTLLMQTPS